MKTEFQWTLKQIQEITNGKILSKHHEIFDGYGTDTRKDLKNKFFVALAGDQFDGHNFINKALGAGATAFIVHRKEVIKPEHLERVSVIEVNDTLLALQQLASAYRMQSEALFLGIAGSNGKTTAKEFTSALISKYKKVHAAKGSLNNHWGVPFTILDMPRDTEVAVIEMGMNHARELELLSQITNADAAVVTTIGIEHIEHFGNLDKIAEAENEIYKFSPKKCLRIYNLDNEYTKKMFQEHGQLYFSSPKPITFSSQGSAADVYLKVDSATQTELNISGTINGISGSARVPVFGRHNVTNLMVACSFGLVAGLTPEQIWLALPECKTNWGRNQWVNMTSGAKLLFDGYNSNPDSMRALASNFDLVSSAGRSCIGIFGQMRELGALSQKYHQEIAEVMAKLNFEKILFIGEDEASFAKGLNDKKFHNSYLGLKQFDEAQIKAFIPGLRAEDTVLVKGSRGVGLEKFVQMYQPLDFKSY
jgi:UDP-N-acetylmuramoyl-tripeptide--D-alanyl-D-alanine ligase